MKRTVIATQSQLQNIGIDRVLTDMEVEVIHRYPDGWFQIKVPPKQEIIDILGEDTASEYYEEYDIPGKYLK